MANIFKLPFILFILSSCLTCCKSKSNWTEVLGIGLPDHDETYNKLHFVDERTGFIGGSHLTLLKSTIQKINFQRNAVLYKTRDQGKTWDQIKLPFLGSVEDIYNFNDTIILKIINDANDTTLFVRSSNMTNWEKLLAFSNGYKVIEMEFENSKNGRLLITNNSNHYLLKYHDNKIDTLRHLDGYFPFALLGEDVISLNTFASSDYFTGYTVVNQNSESKTEFKFDANYNVYSHTKYKDTLFLAVNKKDSNLILKLTKNGFVKIFYDKFSNYVFTEILVSGNKIMSIGNRLDEVGPIGVINSFFVSNDGGLTWDKENLPSPMCIEAPTIYKDIFFISASCPPGFFQIRK